MDKHIVYLPPSALKFKDEPDQHHTCCCGDPECKDGSWSVTNKELMTVPLTGVYIEKGDRPTRGIKITFEEWNQ